MTRWLDQMDAITYQHTYATAIGFVLGMMCGGMLMFCGLMYLAMGGAR